MTGLFRLPKQLRPFALTFRLTGFALLLFIALGIQWFWLSKGLIREIRSTQAPNPDTLGASIELQSHAIPLVSDYAHTVDRPLFMETRRPVPPPSAGPPPKREPPAPVTFKLMGVINSPKGPVALIVDNKGKYKRLRPQEATEGWEVSEIRPDRLVVEQSGMKEDVDLVKKRPKTSQAGSENQPPNPDPARSAPTPQGQAPAQTPQSSTPTPQTPHPQEQLQTEGATEENDAQEDY